MKLHDLKPAEGSRQPRMRVGRGIAAGKGKTAGRGTKGQKARAGGSIPPWFEGGQTPLHMRIPKLRGFTNRFKIEYEVVNVGAIGALADRGAFETEAPRKGAKAGPVTINQDILRAVGLVRTLNKPMKILGAGELSVPLFVVADAFTASARAKIEAAGGSVNVLEIPTRPRPALGVTPDAAEVPASQKAATAAPAPAVDADAEAEAPAAEATAQVEAPATTEPAAQAEAPESPEAPSEPAAKAETPAKPAKAAKAAKAPKAPKASAASTAKASAAPAAEPEATAEEPADEPAAAAADEPDAAEAPTDADEPVASDEAESPSGDDA